MPEERDDLDKRPSPEALLEAATREEGRGRLKIFLGAAPGVGKTYEMLQSASARKREGVDVVVGVVETHGRAETEALLPRPRDHPAPPHRLQGPLARGDGSRRDPGAPAEARAGRRARPHQRPRQPPSQALSRRRGAARRRHRRLYDGQHPAPRKPQRRRRPDHPRSRAARPSRIRSSIAPTTSRSSTSRPTT